MTTLTANTNLKLTVESVKAFLISKGLSPSTSFSFKFQDSDPSKLESFQISITLNAAQIAAIQARFPELVNVV